MFYCLCELVNCAAMKANFAPFCLKINGKDSDKNHSSQIGKTRNSDLLLSIFSDMAKQKVFVPSVD